MTCNLGIIFEILSQLVIPQYLKLELKFGIREFDTQKSRFLPALEIRKYYIVMGSYAPSLVPVVCKKIKRKCPQKHLQMLSHLDEYFQYSDIDTIYNLVIVSKGDVKRHGETRSS